MIRRKEAPAPAAQLGAGRPQRKLAVGREGERGRGAPEQVAGVPPQDSAPPRCGAGFRSPLSPSPPSRPASAASTLCLRPVQSGLGLQSTLLRSHPH